MAPRQAYYPDKLPLSLPVRTGKHPPTLYRYVDLALRMREGRGPQEVSGLY